MTGGIWNTRTRRWVLALFLSCILSSHIVQADPEPENPGLSYSDNFDEDMESLVLLNRLRQLEQREREVIQQERQLTEEEMAIQGMLMMRGRSDGIPYVVPGSKNNAEPLPIPLGRNSKRGSYMALCHFKICNMGRKRQL